MTGKEKKIEQVQDDMVAASKTYVTQTRSFATTVREAWLAPWQGMAAGNEIVTMMVEPWVAMTRATHDRMLEAFETQSHQMIDRTHQALQQVQRLQPIK
jgi:hypothetical protein